MSKFKHECPDWDFLEIDIATDGEAVGCTCFRGDPEADAHYERASKELDAHNEAMGSDTRADHFLERSLESGPLSDLPHDA